MRNDANNDWPATIVLSAVVGAIIAVSVLGLASRLAANSPNDFNPLHDTFAQWIMALSGIVATVASVWALIYLRNTLIENRRIGQAQVRAYLVQDKIDIQWHRVDADAKQSSATFQVRWGNRGNSPALSCALRTHLEVVRVEDIGMSIPIFDREFEALGMGRTDIGSGDDGGWSRAARVLTSDEVRSLAEGKIAVVLCSAASYLDVFGKRVKIQVCSQVHHIVEGDNNKFRFSTYPHRNRYEL